MNRIWIFMAAGAVAFSACAAPRKRKTAVPAPASKSAQQAVQVAPTLLPPTAAELTAQKALYEEGLKFYSEEKYAEAKKAWEQALAIHSMSDLSPHITENLKKTELVLKTLHEIQNKNEKPGSKEGPSR